MRVNDAVLGLLVMLVAGVVFALATSFPKQPLQEYGPGFFPMLLSGLLAASGLALLVQGLREQPRRAMLSLSEWWRRPAALGNVLAVPLAIGFYIVASPGLGFIPCSLLILFALALKFGASATASLLLAAGTTAAMHLVFVKVLGVPLPWGLLERIVYWTP